MPKHRIELSDETIAQAMAGDEQAIRAVISFYRPRIIQKSLRPCYNENVGNYVMYVDPFVCGQLESQLMKAIFTFKK